MSQENPYASPSSDLLADDRSAQLAAVSQGYRWLGWGGIAYVTILYSFGYVLPFATGADRPPVAGQIFGYCLFMTFLASLLVVAGRLDADFCRWYRTARWLAILTAIFLFPVMTIPSILAIRRLGAYQKKFAERR